MDYEKKYKHLLNVAKSYQGNSLEEFLDLVFPELKESEDERIRRCIEVGLTDVDEQRFKDFGTTLKECLAYLEKQKDIWGDKAQNITANMLEDGIKGIQHELIEFLSNTINASWVDIIQSADAYAERIRNIIEKQKEQEFTHHEVGESLEEAVTHQMEDDGDVDDFVRKGLDDVMLKYAELGAEWQKEQKPIEDVIKNITKDKESATNFLKSAGIMDDIGELAEMYRSEQKPAEWSKEDEAFLKVAIAICNRYSHKDIADWLKSLHPRPKQEWSEEDDKMLKSIIEDSQNCHILGVDQIDWLKSLRSQPKQEWSEEDKTHLGWIIECFDSWKYQVPEFADQYQSAIDFLKSLRPQPHWKPSEEQVKYLAKAIKLLVEDGNQKTASYLFELRNDLKKLM